MQVVLIRVVCLKYYGATPITRKFFLFFEEFVDPSLNVPRKLRIHCLCALFLALSFCLSTRLLRSIFIYLSLLPSASVTCTFQ